MRILFFIDAHLASTAPSSRIDDFSQTMLSKLAQLAKICKSDKIDLVICGGDMFHTKDISIKYISQVIKAFKDFPCDVYSIIGNHDIYYGRPDTVDKTPLGILFASGCVKHLKELSFDSMAGPFKIYGVDFNLPLPVPDRNVYSILVAHAFFNESYDTENFLEEDVQLFDMALLGHDHIGYPASKFGNTVVIRPGALSRGTKHKINLVRDVSVNIIDTGSGKIENKTLEVLNPDLVFLRQVTERTDVGRDVKEFVKSLESSFYDKGVSLMALLEEVCKDNSVRVRAIEYFKKYGLIS